MTEIKFHKGFGPTYPVNKEEFTKHTRKKYPYAQKGEWYAYCPNCENPVKLLGLLRPLKKQRPHARHNKGDVEDINDFDESKYEWCPYHRKNADYVKEVKRGEETEEEIKIYNIMREHFDQVIYLLRKELPLYISDNRARILLKDYITYRGWMFYGADCDNIPLMLLNAMRGIPVYGVLIKNNSNLYNFLQNRKEITLIESNIKDYSKVTRSKNEYVNLDFVVINVRFRVDNNTTLHNYIHYNVGEPIESEDKNTTYNTLFEDEIEVAPYSFRKLSNSKKNLYRNRKMLEIANKLMDPM